LSGLYCVTYPQGGNNLGNKHTYLFPSTMGMLACEYDQEFTGDFVPWETKEPGNA